MGRRWSFRVAPWSARLKRRASTRANASDFWSASPDASDSDNAWNLNFNNGNDNWNNRSNAKHVRLVRAGE